ncbi:HAD family hydrolase [Dinoroseobacter sp. S375]|uniref:HAD family hydrolase n=1 Tax=Dinoroseobacter sp. S375 TaxID=3415136 RepID=UPI003C7D8E0B
MNQSVPLEPPGPRDITAGIAAVIFDFDGVIADSEPISLASLRDVLDRSGIPMSLEEVRDQFLGKSLRAITEFATQRVDGLCATDFARLWQDALFAEFRRSLQPVPGVIALLDRLEARGIPFCIASSGTFERIGIALEAMGLTARFPRILSSELVARGKPAPDLFLLAAERLGVTPAECLVVEDSLFGVQAAEEAGMRSVGFIGGGHLVDVQADHSAALRAAGAAVIMASFDDLFED